MANAQYLQQQRQVRDSESVKFREKVTRRMPSAVYDRRAGPQPTGSIGFSPVAPGAVSTRA